MNPPAMAGGDAPAPFHPASSPDYLPREPLRSLQSQRLCQVVARVYEHVPLYRQRMQKHRLTPAEIGGIDQIHQLPLTAKADLAAAYPAGMLAVPIAQVARVHLAGGSAGQPIVVAYTRGDLEGWTEVVVRCLVCCGIRQADVIQNACGHDLLTDGLGLHAGIEALGATAIPVCGGDAERQIMLMKDFGVSAICCTPSHFLYLVERAEKIGVALRDLPLRVGLFLAEPFSEAMRRRIEELSGIMAYDLYGLPEILATGVGAECCYRTGLHLFEDHFYPEVIDPDSGQPLPDGEEGELVLTTLSRQAMPVIRYRTRELTALLAEPCPCGRTLRRIRRIGRRSDEMLVVQGVNLFPSQIEAALLAVEGTLPHYQIVLTQQQGIDQVEVQVEVTSQVFSDRIGAMEGLQAKLAQQIERTLGIHAAVRLVEPHTLQRSQGMAERVIDQRLT